MLRRILLGVTMSLFLVGGCSGGQPPAGQSSDGLDDLKRSGGSASAVASSSGSGGLSDTGSEPLPIQHYMLVGRDRDTVEKALRVLTQKCMQAQGFKTVLPEVPPGRGVLVDITVRRYGAPESREDALEAGFGVPARFDVDPAHRAKMDAWESALSDAERKALMGDGTIDFSQRRRGGCVGEADRQLMGDSKLAEASGLAEPNFVRDLNFDPRSTDSEASRAATGRFAECMRAAGYPDLIDPLANTDSYTSSSGQVDESEKKAALAMYDCFKKTGVREARRAAEVEFQKAAIEANPEAFAQLRKELEDVVRRATEVLGES